MSLTGQEIVLRPLNLPLAARKASHGSCCGPYRWRVPQPDKAGKGQGYYAADDDGTPDNAAQFFLRAVDLPNRRRAGYTTDDGFTTYQPVVLRLPRGRGFLAGWTMGKGMASSFDGQIHETVEGAHDAADNEAMRACEDDEETADDE